MFNLLLARFVLRCEIPAFLRGIGFEAMLLKTHIILWVLSVFEIQAKPKLKNCRLKGA
jgi:hypothetical protein